MPAYPADYSGDQDSLLFFAREQFRLAAEAKRLAELAAMEKEKECKEWEWSDMPDRWNDFDCYHGWHYFVFICIALVLMIIICCCAVFCSKCPCCKKKEENEDDIEI